MECTFEEKLIYITHQLPFSLVIRNNKIRIMNKTSEDYLSLIFIFYFNFHQLKIEIYDGKYLY